MNSDHTRNLPGLTVRSFVRKGEVGDSANCLSGEQLARIDGVCLRARDGHAAAVDGLGFAIARPKLPARA